MLLKWLENGSNAPEGIDIFGIEKLTYGFMELNDVIDELERASNKGRKQVNDVVGGGNVRKKAKKSSSSKSHTS